MSKFIADPKYHGTLARSFALILDDNLIALNRTDRRLITITDDELVEKLVAAVERKQKEEKLDLTV